MTTSAVMRLFVGLLVAVVAAKARADIMVNWYAPSGFYANGTAGAFPDDGINNFNGGETLAQLIWSPSSSIDPVDPANPGGAYLGGDDLLLMDSIASVTNTTLFADYSVGVLVFSNTSYGVTLEGGFVYARIFEDTTPDPGEHYFDSSPVSAVIHNGANPPTTLNHNTDVVNGNELGLIIVPEPGTLCLVAAALLATLARRLGAA